MSGSTQVGGITVPIMAVDHATVHINRVSKNISGLVPTTMRLTRAMTMAEGGPVLGGLSLLSAGIEKVGAKTLDTFHAIEKMAPAIGLITGAVTLGGLLALETRFANIGQNVANLGQRLGIPVDKLTALQGAARLGGLSTEDMSSGLAALDESLRGATFRNDGQKIQAFNAIGVSFGVMGKQARTADEAIRDVANGIKWLNDTRGRGAALREAQNLGLEGLFPLLVRGAAGIDALEAKTKRLGGVMTPGMIERAKALHEGFQSVADAAGGFANKLADAVSPQFTRMSESFAGWISRIAPRFSDWIGTLATRFEHWTDSEAFQKDVWLPLNEGMEHFFYWVDHLTKADFTAFGSAIEYVAEDLAIAGRGALAVLEMMDRYANRKTVGSEAGMLQANSLAQIYDTSQGAGTGEDIPYFGFRRSDQPAGDSWFARHHLPGLDILNPFGSSPQAPITVPRAPSAASGVMNQVIDFFAKKGVPAANIAGILGGGVAPESSFDPTKWNPEHTSYGLFQEDKSSGRLAALQNRYGANASVADQLEFEWGRPEMQEALRQMKGKNATESGSIFARVDEHPRGGQEEYDRRGAASQQFEGEVNVRLDVNAPAGSQVQAQARTSGIAKMSTPPRVVVGMPSAGFQPTPMFTH